LERARPMEYRNTRVAPGSNRALSACPAFRGDVLLVESEHDEHVPHATITSYRGGFRRSASRPHRISDGADDSLSSERCQQSYTDILTSWVSEMVIGDRIGHLN